MLKTTNLHAEIDVKGILCGLSLTANAGQVYAIMGQNCTGKSMLGEAEGRR